MHDSTSSAVDSALQGWADRLRGRIDIPVVAAARVADPTGCGDAYRAGLLHGISRGLSWEESGRLAALIGALKVACKGTQNHHFTPATLAADYRAAFGHAIEL